MKLHNTLSGELNKVTPLSDSVVTLYTCGLTVYSQPHIGNWVAYIYWDILVRTLQANGFSTKRVQNITDVGHLTSDEDSGEDKMLKGAKREGLNAWQVAEKYIQIADQEAYGQLGLLRPDYMPRATDYIPQQINFVRQLEEQGYTYQLDDGIYFDTSKLDDYGKLAQLDVEGLESGARVADAGKKNPTDFALWKFSNPSQKRDMEWDSPWGKGFPGWHLECSVMAREILGDQIDIHTGGIDHIPVHHTNEIAQTEALTKKPFANIWLHANHIKVDGTKISKSLNNGYTLADIVAKGYDLMAFKLMVLSKHYRTEGNFSWDILTANSNRLKHWKSIAVLRWQANPAAPKNSFLDKALVEVLSSLNDDLNTPEALARVEQAFDIVEKTPLNELSVESCETFFEKLDQLFGLKLLESTPDVSANVRDTLNKRQLARNAKDWQSSDDLREQLAKEGIDVRDSASGQIWSYS